MIVVAYADFTFQKVHNYYEWPSDCIFLLYLWPTILVERVVISSTLYVFLLRNRLMPKFSSNLMKKKRKLHLYVFYTRIKKMNYLSILSPVVGYNFLTTNLRKMQSANAIAEKLLLSYFSSFSSVSSSPSHLHSGGGEIKMSNKTKTDGLLSPVASFGATGERKEKNPRKDYVSKIHFSLESTSVIIHFTYYSSVAILGEDLAKISLILGKLYQKEVKIVATKVHYPYLNSTILAQYLAQNSRSNNFLQFQEAILSYPSLHVSSLPSSIAGMKIQLSGRITTEAVIPRITVKSSLLGAFTSKTTGNSKNPFALRDHIDYGKYTTKNELGAFTIKVWIAQRSLSL